MGHCYNSTIVKAPIDAIWMAMRDFHNMDYAKDLIADVEKVGDVPGDEPGAGRILNGAFHETLQSIDDTDYTFSYTIDDGPEPLNMDAVESYVGTVTLRRVSDDNSTFVEWKTAFTTSNDQAVEDFCDPIYIALLAGLKTHFG